jgi:hypothetical protein
MSRGPTADPGRMASPADYGGTRSAPHNLTWKHRGSRIISLTSALVWSGWSTPRPGRFITGNYPLSTVEEGGWAKGSVWTGKENVVPHRDSIPGPSSRDHVVAIPTELSRPAPNKNSYQNLFVFLSGLDFILR